MNPTLINTLFPQAKELQAQAQASAAQLEDAIKAQLLMQAALVVLGITAVVLLSKKN